MTRLMSTVCLNVFFGQKADFQLFFHQFNPFQRAFSSPTLARRPLHPLRHLPPRNPPFFNPPQRFKLQTNRLPLSNNSHKAPSITHPPVPLPARKLQTTKTDEPKLQPPNPIKHSRRKLGQILRHLQRLFRQHRQAIFHSPACAFGRE